MNLPGEDSKPLLPANPITTIELGEINTSSNEARNTVLAPKNDENKYDDKDHERRRRRPKNRSPKRPKDLEEPPGYEGSGYKKDSKDHAAPKEEPANYDVTVYDGEILSENEIREALISFVGEHCCYGKTPAEQMEIRKVEPSSALDYSLETWAQKRSTKWSSEPFRGGSVDDRGAILRPWDVDVPINVPPFEDGKVEIKVPHSETVKSCAECDGLGRSMCDQCNGTGRVQCSSCYGRQWESGDLARGSNDAGGHFDDSDGSYRYCNSCNGSRWRQCYGCSGTGRERCDECDGIGRILCYMLLEAVFDNHKSTFAHSPQKGNVTSMLEDLSGAGGKILLFQENRMVQPIVQFPDPSIVDASARLVGQHRSDSSFGHIMRQRQTITAVPLSCITCCFKENERIFYIYGEKNRVYFPRYFARCCCYFDRTCCSVM